MPELVQGTPMLYEDGAVMLHEDGTIMLYEDPVRFCWVDREAIEGLWIKRLPIVCAKIPFDSGFPGEDDEDPIIEDPDNPIPEPEPECDDDLTITYGNDGATWYGFTATGHPLGAFGSVTPTEIQSLPVFNFIANQGTGQIRLRLGGTETPTQIPGVTTVTVEHKEGSNGPGFPYTLTWDAVDEEYLLTDFFVTIYWGGATGNTDELCLTYG